ncbi:MAG: PqqD family protein [Terriglobales bacterium]
MSEKYVLRSDAIAARMLGDEMMIMSAVDSTFFTLDDVATLVWQAADGQTPISEIAGRICREFDVDQEQAERDVEQFVDELSPHGILLVSETPVTKNSPGQP